jgi:hypothetical protein
VELAWRDFLADMDRSYPAAEWPNERLYERWSELREEASAEADGVQFLAAGEMRAEARVIGALLAERGDERRAEEAEAVKLDMARVVVGEGPEPWMVDTRGEDGVRRWGVVDDANVNMTRLEEWSHAARYALPITGRQVACRDDG